MSAIDLDALLDALADRVAAKLRAELHRDTGAELVDRESCGISKRAWDRAAGKRGGFPAYKDGRKLVAKRADVLAWIERTQRFDRDEPAAPTDETEDEDEDARIARELGVAR